MTCITLQSSCGVFGSTRIAEYRRSRSRTITVITTFLVGTQAAGVTEGVGYSDPVGLQQQPGDDGDEDEEAGMMLPVAVPSHYTLQVAQE